MSEPLTATEALRRSGFTEYRKKALTPVSDITFPPGTTYQTPEGLRAEDEETRCAFDVQGGIYPIRESVFKASYELPDAERATRQEAAPEPLNPQMTRVLDLLGSATVTVPRALIEPFAFCDATDKREPCGLPTCRACALRAALRVAAQGPEHEERGLDVNTVRVSTEALIVVFRRFCLGRYGEAPTEQEFRNMLGRASRLATPEAAPEEAYGQGWNDAMDAVRQGLATPEAAPEDRCPMCGYRHEASADHRWDAKEQQYVATPEAAPEEGRT